MASHVATCTICSEQLGVNNNNRATVMLICGHTFHLCCIGREFNTSGGMQCPICRTVENSDWSCVSPGGLLGANQMANPNRITLVGRCPPNCKCHDRLFNSSAAREAMGGGNTRGLGSHDQGSNAQALRYQAMYGGSRLPSFGLPASGAGTGANNFGGAGLLRFSSFGAPQPSMELYAGLGLPIRRRATTDPMNQGDRNVRRRQSPDESAMNLNSASDAASGVSLEEEEDSSSSTQ